MSLTSQKTAELRAIGDGFTDVLLDTLTARDRISIVNTKLGDFPYHVTREDWQVLSSIFLYVGELSEHPDIWTAITTSWNERHLNETVELKAAMDSDLVGAGYTLVT